MNEQEEFNRWLFTYRIGRTFESWEINDLKQAWHACDKLKDKEIKALREEIRYLRYYGNKDCLAQADDARERGELEDSDDPTRLLTGE